MSGGKIISPVVSVIIPTHNYGRFITRAIDSVLTQDHVKLDIIVVDDGSTDDTRAIVEDKYAGQVRYSYQPNQGPAAARNLGITQAKGDLITFLDADDYYLPGNLARKVECLNADPELSWLFSDVRFVGEDGEGIEFGSEHFQSAYAHKPAWQGQLFRHLLQYGNFLSTASIMLRKECFDAIGLFDIAQMQHEDYLLWLALARRFPNFLYIDEPLVCIVKHASSYGMNDKHSLTHRLRLYQLLERMYGEDIRQFSHAWRRRYADALNRLGVIAMQEGDTAGARSLFWASIKKCPYQGFAYRAWLRA